MIRKKQTAPIQDMAIEATEQDVLWRVAPESEEQSQAAFERIVQFLASQRGPVTALPEACRDDVSALFRGFNDLYNQSFSREGIEEDYFDDELDSRFMRQVRQLNHLMYLDLEQAGRRDFIDATKKLPGLGYMKQLTEDREFQDTAMLADYATYNIWLSFRGTVWARGDNDQESQTYQAEQERIFENTARTLTPLVSSACARMAEDEDLENLTRTYRKLNVFRYEPLFQEALFGQAMDRKARLTSAVAYANATGFMNSVDALSTEIKKIEGLNATTGDDNLSKSLEDLRWVYQQMQGDEVQLVLHDFSEQYKAIAFEKYHLNSNELTAFEADQIEAAADRVAKREGISDTHDLKILDSGAGPGRHSLALSQRGYQHITALDYDARHINLIREADAGGKIRTVRGSWFDLTPLRGRGGLFEQEEFDLYFCGGRSALHVNRPEDELRWWDEVTDVTSLDGTMMFDTADPNFGRYAENAEHLSKNAEALGLEGFDQNWLFDGPDTYHKINRMVLTEEQIQTYAELFGYKVREPVEKIMGNGTIRNLYYEMTKEEDPQFWQLTGEEVCEKLHFIGLLRSDIDPNAYVKTWGMTIGQAIMEGIHLRGGGEKSVFYYWDYYADGTPYISSIR